jgi:hypothetical protein
MAGDGEYLVPYDTFLKSLRRYDAEQFSSALLLWGDAR